tara:strand:- start:425 stop:547 length:123 start_codon:yes stop_codon:yes gene_type:complete
MVVFSILVIIAVILGKSFFGLFQPTSKVMYNPATKQFERF